jgi:hypothetical protein
MCISNFPAIVIQKPRSFIVGYSLLLGIIRNIYSYMLGYKTSC